MVGRHGDRHEIADHWLVIYWNELLARSSYGQNSGLGGLMTAIKFEASIIPRFETEKVPPSRSTGASLLALALAIRALASRAIERTP